MYTAILTHGHHAFKREKYSYSNAFGLLTVVMNDRVHKIARILGNRLEYISLLCGSLGYSNGHSIHGPSLKLYRSTFSRLASWCDIKDGFHSHTRECFEVEITNKTDGHVDYIVCGEGNSEVSRQNDNLSALFRECWVVPKIP